MSPVRTLILFGAGPGIGNHTASTFATNGFTHIILLARNTQRLQTSDAAFITKAVPGAKVDTLGLDLSDLSAIPDVLSQLEKLTQGEEVEAVFFNAARIKPSGVLDVPVEEIDEDFKVCISQSKSNVV